MTLVKYKKKRKFDKTPEPSGRKKRSSLTDPLTFVIQKHQATRLHYDFRLEMEGVLKSWAVPKGPSLNPEDKRLAVMVEDHPMDYADFEGIIPKGNYGAGTVMVWDRGVYMPYIDEVTSGESLESSRKEMEKILLKQLETGHLTILMLGEKVKGEFALVKSQSSEEEDAWLLIKKGDEYADVKKDILEKDHSVLSGRSMEEIKAQSGKKKDIWYSQPKDLDLAGAPKHSLPEIIRPMLAESAQRAFDDPNFLFEMKWDGYRAIAEIEAGKVRLYSRNHINYAEKFSPIYETLQKFPGNAVLDGEVVMVDKDGKPHFQWVQDYPASRKEGELLYYVFDLLSLNGHDLRGLPLIKRKELLKELLPPLPHLAFSDHIEGSGKAFFEQIKEMKLEGIVAKKMDSPYRIGLRSKDWLKIKALNMVDAVICGFTRGRKSRKYFGALVVGQKVNGKLKYIGHVGGGFDDKKLREIHQLLLGLVVEECPFEEVPETNEEVTWVKPKLLCEVSFSNWTSEGIMRHPLFVKLVDSFQKHIPHLLSKEGENKTSLRHHSFVAPRNDGHNEQVFNPSGLKSEDSIDLKVGKRTVEVSNPSKVFWPSEGYTKLDLIHYYREMAPVILPYLVNRPQSLLRYPHGIKGESFFQKDVSSLNLDWVMRVPIESESSVRKKIEFLLCQDEATLVYMINLGCIDFNPWNSTIRNLEKPDYLIIDLDPEAVSFQVIIKVAIKVREFLEKLDIASFPKTSGARGLHIFIPMGAQYTHEQVRQFAELLCMHIQVEIPDISSMRRDPKDRQGKVYLDYLQNGRGKTLASVYSVRAVTGAQVSCPLEWSEVNSKLDPSLFTIKNMLKRVEKKGDLFKGVYEKEVDMKKTLSKLEF